LIKLDKVSKVYANGHADIIALNEVSLQVAPGILIAIQGASGSGKSTLLNILGCLDRPTSGMYTVDDADIGKLSEEGMAILRNQKFGFVFQSFHLLPRYTALENVMLPFLYSLSPPANPEQTATEMLERVGLGNRARHLPGELSGGQQQRVAIARALVNKPTIILADEPTGALDSKSSQEIMDLLSELNADGMTVIIITHEPGIAAQCPYMLTLADGRIHELRVPDTGRGLEKVVAYL
jgi:putative ABC transport system ATP-binding protein